MARGWDSGNIYGTSRIVCANPPGPGASSSESTSTVLPPEALQVNVLTGMFPYTAGPPPLVALGVGHFSYECWHHWRKIPDGPLGGNWWDIVGFYEGPDYVYRCSYWPQAHWLTPGITAYYDAVTGVLPNPVSPGFDLLPVSGWHHIALNYDRAGNLEVFNDGISIGTVAIDNINAGSVRYYALTTNSSTEADCDVPGEAISLVHAFSLVGPSAAHAGILTTAQLNDSLRGKRVQNLATTTVNWDWRNIVGHTGWETDPDKIIAKATDFLTPGITVAAPIGAPGTVSVPDTSGSGNNWVLPTLATYGTTTATKAKIGFISDLSWAN